MTAINMFDRLTVKQIAKIEKKQELKIESTNSLIKIEISEDESMIDQHNMRLEMYQIEQPVLKFSSSLVPIHNIKFKTSSN